MPPNPGEASTENVERLMWRRDLWAEKYAALVADNKRKEEELNEVRDILVGFYGLVTEDRTPESRLERIAKLLDVPEKEWGWRCLDAQP